MKKLLFTVSAFALLVVSSVALIPTEAEAIPVFARKYGIACNSCHTFFPQLSKMGVAFRERGFRFAAGKEDLDMQNGPGKNVEADDKAVFASNFPFTVRTQLIYSNAGPIEGEVTGTGKGTTGAVMPGHRPGMLDGATDNAKIGMGEFGLISSGSYDDFSWWMDSSLKGGIGMLEGIYYVNDLLKVRLGRVQNNVGYGMTMMAKRPIGYGWANSAQMAGATMLNMVDGISIHGTTNGDTGVGTYYNLSYGLAGNSPASTVGPTNANPNEGKKQTTIYARVAQEFMDSHIVGVYGYQAKNYSSEAFGGEAGMYMAMGSPTNMNRNAMFFDKVSRYGVDFAYDYGEPMQVWGAFTTGKQINSNGTELTVNAFTVNGEWIAKEGWMLGAKYDSSQTELQMKTNTALKPSATTHATLYGVHQIAENVQAILSYTKSDNVINSMGAAGGKTTVDQANFNTLLFVVDIAL